ncbi:MAG: S8 family serine peptidase [Clostridiaceae bacterium]
MQNVDGLLNLLANVPPEVRAKLAVYSNNDEILRGKIEVIALLGGQVPVEGVRSQVVSLGGTFEDIGYGFAIIIVNVDDLNAVASNPGIQYIELPKTLFTSFQDSNRAACVFPAWQTYGLSGRGVLVGFLDSGIDYLHPAFKDSAGNTRIEYIYDLSQGGVVYNKEQINTAIKSENPLAVVSEQDLVGHGTHVAGTACGGGNINIRYRGVAYESSIAMVKMTGQGKVNYGKSTQLLRGINFLVTRSKELRMPLVINLSFSTNDGAHDGSSLLEQYINIANRVERISFAIAAGNEGASSYHFGTVSQGEENITISVGEQESILVINFYKNFLADMTVQISNPQGITTSEFNLKQGYIQGDIGVDQYYIYNTGPKPFSLNGEIIVSLATRGTAILPGQWRIRVRLTGDEKILNAWLPVSEGLNPNTKFLEPNAFNTLGIPATVDNAISVGSYNSATNTISPFSGRGRVGQWPQKPDIVAPGENIESAIPGGSFDALSGTSMATPHVAGASALLMEYGIVKGNDLFLYGDRLKYYLLKSARRDRTGVDYPSPIWGYGTLCVGDALNMILGSRNLYRQAPTPEECKQRYLSNDYQELLVEYQGDIDKALSNLGYVCIVGKFLNYAILSVRPDMVEQLLRNTPEIVYDLQTSMFTLNAISPVEAANITTISNNPYLDLKGQGVIVGLIDTGLDYMNNEFQNEDDTTRIISIWDQMVQTGTPPEGFIYGSEYSREQINQAIALGKNNGDPRTIVPSTDDNGHGTASAGVIGARGRNPEIISSVPLCEFMVVKLKEAKQINKEIMETISDDVPIYQNTDIIFALQYLYEKATELNRPMVVFLPLGSSRGGHDGSASLEEYIDELSRRRGFVVVIGVGNEGDSETHIGGEIRRSGDVARIELNAAEGENRLYFQIWGRKPDKYSLGIISPSGETIDTIPSKLNESELINFVFEGTEIFIRYRLPEERTGDELIEIWMRRITPGIWLFNLVGDYIVDGRYDAWLPQRALLKTGTRFLNSTSYNTLTIPSTSFLGITCGYYNQNDNSLVSTTGRGYTRDGRVRPDLVCGGINVVTTAVGGGTTIVSGSSIATAVLAGAVAILLQWGIVNRKDPTMFAIKIRNYLIRGTRKRGGDIYPNAQLGYGFLDMVGVFEAIKSSFIQARTIEEKENKDKIYIRIPKEINDLLKNKN